MTKKKSSASLLSLLILHTATASTLPPPSPFHPQTIKRFITYRCQNPFTPSSAIWSWEGRLVDPSNGKIIANVEGIELVRTLSEVEKPPSPPSSSTSSSQDGKISTSSEQRTSSLWRVARGLRRMHDLKVKTMLTMDREWDYAATVLCRKLFCYTPIEGDDKRLLLKEYKHHPNSPIKNIPSDQAIALYDTATTYISRENGQQMEVVTEWPDGRWIQSCASVGLVAGGEGLDSSSSIRGSIYDDTTSKSRKSQQPKKFPFGFTVYVKRSGKGEIPSLPKMMVNTKNANTKKSIKRVPRSKFIQFGKDEDSENRRFGARETYSYIMEGNNQMSRTNRYKRLLQETISNIGEHIGLWDFNLNHGQIGSSRGGGDGNSCTVQYTRYGEAPPWYAPGKMCTLELVGRRVDSVTDAPPLAATLAATRVPGFMSVHTPIAFDTDKKRRKKGAGLDASLLKEQLREDTAAMNAVRWFRGNEGSLPLQILPADGNNEEQDVTRKVIDTTLNVIHRIRSATTLRAATEN